MLLSKTRSVSPGSDGITVYTGSEDLAVHLLRLRGILFHARRIIFNINLPMFVMTCSICKSEDLLVTVWHLPCWFLLCSQQQIMIFKVGKWFPSWSNSNAPHCCCRLAIQGPWSFQGPSLVHPRTRIRGLLMCNKGLLPALSIRT